MKIKGTPKRPYYWHCLQCGAHDPVEPTGSDEQYVLGDHEPCIDCGDGTAHVMTLSSAAAYEQGIALGMSVGESFSLALKKQAME